MKDPFPTTSERGAADGPPRVVSAGGVVFSRRGGRLQIIVIEDHRGRWTLPKGKREEGESLEETALREIWEETGIEGRVIQPLDTIEYDYRHSRRGMVRKVVHYYLVEKTTDASNPNAEPEFIARWLEPDEAWRLQGGRGFAGNRSVLRKALEALQVPVPDGVDASAE